MSTRPNNGILKAAPLVGRGAKPRKLPLIFTVYNRQSLDKQAAVKDNIMLAERHNYLGESACSNNSTLIAYFVLYTLNNSVQSAGIRVEQTALETVDSIRADYLFRCFKINFRELQQFSR